VASLSVREAAKVLQVPPSRIHRERERVFQNPPEMASQIGRENDEERLPL